VVARHPMRISKALSASQPPPPPPPTSLSANKKNTHCALSCSGACCAFGHAVERAVRIVGEEHDGARTQASASQLVEIEKKKQPTKKTMSINMLGQKCVWCGSCHDGIGAVRCAQSNDTSVPTVLPCGGACVAANTSPAWQATCVLTCALMRCV
jgi:hypothetical protein